MTFSVDRVIVTFVSIRDYSKILRLSLSGFNLSISTHVMLIGNRCLSFIVVSKVSILVFMGYIKFDWSKNNPNSIILQLGFILPQCVLIPNHPILK